MTCIKGLVIAVPFFAAACTQGTLNLSSEDLRFGYQWTVEQYVAAFDGTAANFSDVPIRPGPIMVAIIPVMGDPTPRFSRVGDIRTCGASLCFFSSLSNQNQTLVAVRNLRGTAVGLESVGRTGNKFLQGFMFISGAQGSRSIGVWYQTSDQLAAATELYRATAGAVSNVHQRRSGLKAQQRSSDAFAAVMGGLQAAAVISNQLQPQSNAQAQMQRQQAQQRQREANAQQQLINQQNFDRQIEERRRALEIARQTEAARQAEERRQLDQLRQSQAPAGVPRPTCIPIEIGCDIGGCTGVYAGLPPCAR